MELLNNVSCQSLLSCRSLLPAPGASFEGGRHPPRKKKKRKKERKKEEREKKKERKKERKGTMNNVTLLHIKCCFFKFFSSPVALKNKKNFLAPKKKLK